MFEINDQTKKIIFIGITVLLFILFIISNNSSNNDNNKVIRQLEEAETRKKDTSCCGNSSTSSNINKIRDMYQEEEENLFNNDEPIIINFNTDWCYYSKKFQPIWDEFTKKMNGKNIVVKDVKCDISQNESICAKYDIEGFPTIKLIKNNKVYEFNGRRTVSDLTNFVNQYI
jgi:thioredoxin-like negative regulator of GroEL